MNSNIKNTLQKPIKEYMDKFEQVYRSTLKSDVRLINTVINYMVRTKGKQIRPILCLLSAKLCGEPSENTYKAAALIEIIHVATLCHDDTVDDSNLRRGWPSINRIWKNKLSILVGDYMFSKSLSNMIQIRDFEALEILSRTAERLSQGEILQIEKIKKQKMTHDVYYKMVSDKTASLFSAACELGCLTVNNDYEKRSALLQFGEKFGIVFQIRDDLLDIIGNSKVLGKPTNFDLKKNMQTLPLIHIFNKLSRSEEKKVKRKLNSCIKHSEKKEIRKIIKDMGGVQFAQDQIVKLSNDAMEHLSIFPDSKYKKALSSALTFNVDRTQ